MGCIWISYGNIDPIWTPCWQGRNCVPPRAGGSVTEDIFRSIVKTYLLLSVRGP